MSGARDKTRLQMKVTIRVEKIEFDVEKCALRLNGPNVKENEHIRMGQYHTIEIELTRPFTVIKERWDSIHLDLLDDLADPMKRAEIAAVVMQEGLAHVCLIKAAMTKTCARIERVMPKKKFGNVAFDKSMEAFFREIYDAIARLDFEVLKVVLVGSPGFLNEDFMTYLLARALQETDARDVSIHKHKSKFLKVQASSGYRNAIEELLGKPEVMAQLNDVKAVDEVRALQAFYDMLSKDEDRACYGLQEVLQANELNAVEQLLITDSVYRSNSDLSLRAKVIALMDSVKESGGVVYKFSALHVSGEALNNYTGVAAILRFPINTDELVEAAAAAAAVSAGNKAKK